MAVTYDHILRLFLNAADPYSLSGAAPEKTVWPYLRSHLWPLRRVLIASALVTILAAGVEVWLIQYAGQLVDKLAFNRPDEFWLNEGPGLLIAALAVLLFRPFAQFLRLAVNDIALDCNAANLVRWHGSS